RKNDSATLLRGNSANKSINDSPTGRDAPRRDRHATRGSAQPPPAHTPHNKERTSKFVATYGDRSLRSIGDEQVAAWLKGGRNVGTVPALRAFFNDAMSGPAGRLIDRNPFAALGLRGSRGRRDKQPPTQVE